MFIMSLLPEWELHINSAILWLWVSESLFRQVRKWLYRCVCCCALACVSSGDSLCMRAQFCVYACALILAGSHGCTGWFSEKVKLTQIDTYILLVCKTAKRKFPSIGLVKVKTFPIRRVCRKITCNKNDLKWLH